MKKQLLALILVLVCAVTLFAGCKDQQDAETTAAPETVSTAATEAAGDTTVVPEQTTAASADTEAITTEPVTEEATTEEPTTEPTETQPPATQPPATQPPATQPPATQPPATQPPATQPPATEPPASSTLSSAQMKAKALSLIGQPVSALYAAIGQPTGGSSYASSCNGPGEDGELYYDGFIVYTYRENGNEIITDVWDN